MRDQSVTMKFMEMAERAFRERDALREDVSRLTAERDGLKEMAVNWQTAAVSEMEKCISAERERDGLLATLKPFAVAAEHIPANYHPTLIVNLEIKGSSALKRAGVTVSDLFAARDACATLRVTDADGAPAK